MLFAALADVRNDWGIKPVREPRGHDCQGLYPKKLYMGDHSFSWLTLGELLSYDWDQPITDEGIITYETWKKWVDGGRGVPEAWSQGA